MQEAPNVAKRPFSPPSFPAKRKRRGRRGHVRNDHDGTSRRKRRLLSSVLISSFPNRELNSRFGGDFDFPSDSLEPTKKTASVFLDLSREIWSSSKFLMLSEKDLQRSRQIRTILQILAAGLIYRSYSNAATHKLGRTVTGGAYQNSRRVAMCDCND